MKEILECTLSEIAKKIRSKEISSEDVTRFCLDRIYQTKEKNAFISVYKESIKVAKACDTMLEAGHILGPLHGVPIALKDNIYLADHVTTAGSKILRDFKPEYDATTAARLKSAGAVIIGKTNMHEFAWGGTTENPHYGKCQNAWDPERNPAGSSGGSGSAVASRCCFGALGTDTGGSVRLPSAVNGISGIRPSVGRVSNYGVYPLAYSEDTVGPMCRTVEDCAIMLQIIAGQDEKDASTALKTVDNYQRDLKKGIKGKKIGIIKDYCLCHNQKDVQRAYVKALEQMEQLGAQVVEVELKYLDELIDAQLIVDAAEPSAIHLNYMREQPENYGRDVRTLLEVGAGFRATQYLQALQYRTLLIDHMNEVFEEVDAIATPTLPFTALKIGEPKIEIEPGMVEDNLSANMRYTAIASITGRPALSVPCGFDHKHLPIGMQLIGQAFDEKKILRIGNAYQQSTEFHKMSPWG